MNAGPYSSEAVRHFLEKEFVPLKSQCFWDKRTDLMKKFDIAWTPTFLIQDMEGKVHRKLVGFLPEDDFLAHLKFGKGMLFFEKFRNEECTKWFDSAIADHPTAGVLQEALFFRAVAEYKKTHDASQLRRLYDTLAEKHPQSEWKRRAEAYSQIPLK